MVRLFILRLLSPGWPLKALGQSFQEATGPRGPGLAPRPDQRNDGGGGKVIVGEDPEQSAGAQTFRHIPLGPKDKAIAGQCPFFHHFAIMC